MKRAAIFLILILFILLAIFFVAERYNIAPQKKKHFVYIKDDNLDDTDDE